MFVQPTTSNEAILAQHNQALFNENQVRSQNEQALYNAWVHEKQERQKMDIIIQQMKIQIDSLQAKMEKKEQQQNGAKSTVKDTEYLTDEEELSKETEWIRVRNTKKRKASNSPGEVQSIHRQRNKPEESQTIRKPPPVIINKLEKYDTLVNHLTDKRINFQASMIAGGNIKINVKDEASYRNLTKTLNDTELEWYSFEDKQSRPLKVVVRKLHQTCQVMDILEDLKTKGYRIENVTQLLRGKDKTLLPLFALSFSKEENVKKVYEIKEILHMKVTIEAFRKPKLIPQCKRCQEYGHTQNYCRREPRCVKCIGKHLTKDCKKSQNEEPKCVHCGEAHPANYRGCTTAVALQKLRNKQTARTTPQNKIADIVNAVQNQPREVNQMQTYAQITQSEPQQTTGNDPNPITNMLQILIGHMNKQEEFNKLVLARLNRIEARRC